MRFQAFLDVGRWDAVVVSPVYGGRTFYNIHECDVVNG
jgi:hypothetical protein